MINSPEIKYNVTEHLFSINYHFHDGRTYSIKGDYSNIIEVNLPRSLLYSMLYTWPLTCGIIGTTRPYPAEKNIKYYAGVLLRLPDNINFFELDFTALNKELFGIDSPDFIWETPHVRGSKGTY